MIPKPYVDFRCEFDVPKFCDLMAPEVLFEDPRFSTYYGTR